VISRQYAHDFIINIPVKFIYDNAKEKDLMSIVDLSYKVWDRE